MKQKIRILWKQCQTLTLSKVNSVYYMEFVIKTVDFLGSTSVIIESSLLHRRG